MFFCLLIPANQLAQQISIRGKILDSATGEILPYANIRMVESSIGTSANKNGEYELKVFSGNYKIAATYIGYLSDTLAISANNNLEGIDFHLKQTDIALPEITIRPGENPAIEIMRNAIKRKVERNGLLKDYNFEAYTKGVIRTEDEINPDKNSISIGVGIDTSELFISGIIENQSRGFFKRPDLYKEIIVARKQTSNFPSSVNILTGGRFIQNFYEDAISFLGIDLPGPLANTALEYYDYVLQSQTAIDNDTIFVIELFPLYSINPGFVGTVFIKNNTYDLIKVDLQLNRAANRGGIFDSINVFQQFSLIDLGIYMPVDYRLFAKANVLSLARFGFELSTILYNYKLNSGIDEDFFDRAVLTVLPDADSKDSIFWFESQTIPGTGEEITAYNRIDSLSKIPFSFWDEFSFLSARVKVTDGWYVTSPLAIYHFNSVEGHAMDLGVFAEDLYDYRLKSQIDFSYGFSDKRLKTDFSGFYLFGDYRTTKVSLNAYNTLKVLFGASEGYRDLTSTVLALISKYEFRDYYYSKGFDLAFEAEVTQVISVTGGFSNYSDRDAFKNSDFSFFARDKQFEENPSINEVDINETRIGFGIDLRNYIEDGLFRRRINNRSPSVWMSGMVSHSNDTWLGSNMNFTKYEFVLQGIVNILRSAAVGLKIYTMVTDGNLPYQNLYALPGNIDVLAQDFTFRTLNINEILGEKAVALHMENYLSDELFRLINFPFLRKSELQLKVFFNAGYSVTDDESQAVLPYPVKQFKSPFYEAGFGIGHILLPIEIDFAWKLNHRGNNNFRVGINSFVF